jgi:hypothetical protein
MYQLMNELLPAEWLPTIITLQQEMTGGFLALCWRQLVAQDNPAVACLLCCAPDLPSWLPDLPLQAQIISYVLQAQRSGPSTSIQRGQLCQHTLRGSCQGF